MVCANSRAQKFHNFLYITIIIIKPDKRLMLEMSSLKILNVVQEI